MKYPDKVTHSFRSSSLRTRTLVFRPFKGPWPIGKMFRGTMIGTTQRWEVHYRHPTTATWGCLKLPDGWQDMDRTWTAQDIYWEDKYDCENVQERVLQKEMLKFS